MQRSSSYSNCTMLLVIIGQPRIRTKLASFKQILLEQLMNFRVRFQRSIFWMRGITSLRDMTTLKLKTT
ncbi:hypothetical protein YC2023_109088 [Brassica napus]